jgi:hypothetical protein
MAKTRRKANGGGVATEIDNNGYGVATETAPQDAGDTTSANIDRERVAQRAYELYLARGGSDGRAMDDWLAAERELTERIDAPIHES